MAIRYDKKLNQEINKTIKNFNQKVARLEKMGRELLPSKITKQQLKESSYNRKDLQRKLKQLQRFSKRGIEEIVETKGGVKLTKYELQNIKKENARIKQSITRRINELKTQKPKVFGKVQASTFSEMGETEFLNLVARRKALDKDVEKINAEELNRLKKLLQKSANKKAYMDNVFKESYFKMLADLGYYYDYDKEKLNEMRDKLYKLKPEKFLKLFNDDKAIKAIIDYYPFVTQKFTTRKINPMDYKEDVVNLYDALYDNLDEILKGYI